MRASASMSTNLRTSFPSPLAHLAFALSLFSSANLVAAQSAPPPAPRQVIPAPPPAAPSAPPAAGYPAAPPPAQPQPQAYPQQAQPGAYPQQTQPGAYPQESYQQPPGAYQAPPAGYGQPPPYQGYQSGPGPIYQPARRRPSRGLMITGASILGASYLLSIAIGAALLDEENDPDDYDYCANCEDVAPWLFMPVAGPFIAMSQTDDGDWGLWFLGMVQVVGTGLMVGGIVKYKNSKRASDMQGYSWDLGNERKLTLDVSGSTRSAGPRLKLAF